MVYNRYLSRCTRCNLSNVQVLTLFTTFDDLDTLTNYNNLDNFTLLIICQFLILYGTQVNLGSHVWVRMSVRH